MSVRVCVYTHTHTHAHTHAHQSMYAHTHVRARNFLAMFLRGTNMCFRMPSRLCYNVHVFAFSLRRLCGCGYN